MWTCACLRVHSACPLRKPGSSADPKLHSNRQRLSVVGRETTHTVLLDKSSKKKAASALWCSCPRFFISTRSQGVVNKPNWREWPAEQDYWLVTFKRVQIMKVKECQKTAWRLGLSTSTMWAPGIEHRLFGSKTLHYEPSPCSTLGLWRNMNGVPSMPSSLL